MSTFLGILALIGFLGLCFMVASGRIKLLSRKDGADVGGRNGNKK